MHRLRGIGSIAALCVSGLATLCPSAGQAALGDTFASVQSDGVRLKATLRVEAAGAYTVHELQLPTGTAVREYLGPAGMVFAVTWRGPFKPDLRQLLGQYFENYSSAPRSAGSTRSRMAIDSATLVMRAAGHMRSHMGLAYAPQWVPAGVNPEALQ